MFHDDLDYFQDPSLGGRPTTKLGDHDTPNTHNRWFILLYQVWGPAGIEIRWNGTWVRGRVTCSFTLHLRICDHTTRFWRCRGIPFGHFLLGSHNFMVTAFGLVCEVALTYNPSHKKGPQTVHIYIWPLPKIGSYDWEEPAVSYRINRLKFRTTGKLPIVLGESIEYTPIQ